MILLYWNVRSIGIVKVTVVRINWRIWVMGFKVLFGWKLLRPSCIWISIPIIDFLNHLFIFLVCFSFLRVLA